MKKKILESIINKVKCIFRLHEWGEQHSVIWGSTFSLWYYCKNCDKRKVEDYDALPVTFVFKDFREAYKIYPKLVNVSVHKDPNKIYKNNEKTA